MRYYLVTIQHNKVVNAENRTVPKAFDTIDEAVAEFHTSIGKDMKNGTLDWALGIVFDSNTNIIRKEKWEDLTEEIPEDAEG